MTVTVNFTGLEPIADALNNLAKSLGASGFVTTVKEKPVVAVAPVQPQAPVTAPTLPPVTQPAQPSVNTPVIPTTTVSYTLDDLARAAMTLMDAGHQGDLIGLLGEFGVDALPALPVAHYGTFATRLREMGAHI
ncbi:MAG: hypothetical protein RR446_04005 [Lachnospiraceae bacterium]